jgi:hypothetical protein
LREERFLNRPGSQRRTLQTSRQELRRKFNIWADDAERYEASIRPHERDDILVVDGTMSREEQLLAISEALAISSKA